MDNAGCEVWIDCEVSSPGLLWFREWGRSWAWRLTWAHPLRGLLQEAFLAYHETSAS
jgi:hypothetical protein